MLVVKFFSIYEDDGNREVGAVFFDGQDIHTVGRVTERLMDDLFFVQGEGPVDRGDPEAVARAMRTAPERMAGTYFWAHFEDIADEA